MPYKLAEGVSFCRTSGRFVFLDVAQNRYFALPNEVERSFARWLAADELSGNDRECLAEIAESGILLSASPAEIPPACPPPPPAARAIADEESATTGAGILHALLRFAEASLALKLLPLSMILERLGRRKRALDCSRSSVDAVYRVAAALKTSALLATPLNRCLPRSITAAHMLLDWRCSPELIIGVRLQPFAAHCWVQCAGLLVTETVDEVGEFTPILTV